jgi:hypothetical protein
MKEEAPTDAQLRQFLLGKVDDEERQRVESLFLTDSLMKERVLAAEQELFDDYLEESLSPADRERFLSLYGDTAAQRRKLRIAKSVQQWAMDQSKTSPIVAKPANSIWSRLLVQLRQKPVLVIPIAVAAAVAIVVTLVWINTRTPERETEYLAFNQELAQLNTPSRLREPLTGLSQLTLKPVSVRSIEAESELKRRPDNAVAEIRLLWMQKEDYPTYQAVLRRPGDDRPYPIPNLTIQNENGKFIRVRVPVHLMTRGDHQLELSGVSADGSKSSPEVYSFTVSE